MLSPETGGAYGQGWRTGYGVGYEHGLHDGLERSLHIDPRRVRRPDEGGSE